MSWFSSFFVDKRLTGRNEYPQLEIECAVTKVQEQHLRTWRGGYRFIVLGACHQGPGHQIQVRTIGYPYLDSQPDLLATERPVCYPVDNKVCVGNDYVSMIEVAHPRSTSSDMLYFGPHPVKLDHVADPDRLFKEQDQAADEIVDDLLQAETDADPKGTDHNGELRKLYTQRGDGKYEADQDDAVVDQLGYRFARRRASCAA